MCRFRALSYATICRVRHGVTLAIFVAVAAVISGIACGCGSSAPTAGLAKVLDCQGSQPSVRPTELILACGDGTDRAINLEWTSWDASHAIGSGEVAVTDCSLSCAIGSRQSYPADLEARGAKVVDGITYLTELDIHFRGASPTGKAQLQCSLSDPSTAGGCADALASSS
jgi:hypothetical protein